MKNSNHLGLAFAILLALVGCASGESTTKVFKHRGSVVCFGGGTPPETMVNELVSAGITVISLACGNDGLIGLPTCGANTGDINIFEIPQADLSKAQALSFNLLSELQDPTKGLNAQEVPCP